MSQLMNLLAHHETHDLPFWALLMGAVVVLVVATLARKQDNE
jgi:hypothetical protein